MGEESVAIPWFEGALEEEVTSASPPPLPPASASEVRSNSPFRDEGEIARGGMGAIRRLYDEQLRRRVALKAMTPELASDAASAQRFLDEARITGLLDHPNIVPIHDLVVDDKGLASYTMKLVKGQTLTELIAAQKTHRDLENILECLIKVCDALSFAHGRGVIHRDLKPDNIMVGTHGQVYVMDWGLALVQGESRAIVDGAPEPDGMVVGTVAYMSPEQARGLVSKTDARTDVFGVGAMLYKALTGSPPYPGEPMQVLKRVQQAQVTPPEQVGNAAMKPPPHLSQVAMKAMAANPDDRFQSADELAAALREFLRGGNWFPQQLFPAGSVIVKEGDAADAAYIITSGRCETRQVDPGDPSRSHVLRVLGPGDVFGETAIFADAPRSASVVALEEVRAVVVERAAIENLTHSSWLGLFVKALADRFLQIDAELAEARKSSI